MMVEREARSVARSMQFGFSCAVVFFVGQSDSVRFH